MCYLKHFKNYLVRYIKAFYITLYIIYKTVNAKLKKVFSF